MKFLKCLVDGVKRVPWLTSLLANLVEIVGISVLERLPGPVHIVNFLREVRQEPPELLHPHI